jgi:hypothetical protein
MLIQDQVTLFQWLLYIKHGGPRLARCDFATLLRHNTTKSLPTPGLELSISVLWIYRIFCNKDHQNNIHDIKFSFLVRVRVCLSE